MRHLRSIAPLAGLGLVLLFAGCPPKGRPPALAGVADPASGSAASPGTSTRAVDAGPDIQGVRGDGPAASDFSDYSSFDQSGTGGPLQDVAFEYDSHVLSDDGRGVLAKNAEWLKQNPSARVIIEGHCDERGTVEYNLALGEQRALAARDYLKSLGVAQERMRTASYGKERPLDPQQNEAAWARNRRAHFSVSQ